MSEKNPAPKASPRRKAAPKPRFTALRILLGGLLGAAGVYSLVTYVAFETTAIHGRGVIRDLQRHVHRTGRRGGAVATVQPVIEFTPQGAEHAIKARSDEEERDSFTIGEEVDIEYQPTVPEKTVRIDTGVPSLDAICALLGVGIFGHVLWQMLQYRAASKATA
jgi:hypothetical protein